jgi:hypothetical protein
MLSPGVVDRRTGYGNGGTAATHELSETLGAHEHLQRLHGHDRTVSRHDESSHCRSGRKHERLPDALCRNVATW